MMYFFTLLLSVAFACFAQPGVSTIALWAFDEQAGIYPSCVLSDQSDNDYPLVLGPGGQIVPGKFGNALDPRPQQDIELPQSNSVAFGMKQLPPASGRSVAPLNWYNARFAALMTRGENHLRKKVAFSSVTNSSLNLGDFDWTVEFWLQTTRQTDQEGVIFEMGTGPRGENEDVMQFLVNRELDGFRIFSQSSYINLSVSHDQQFLSPDNGLWHHYAFVYDAGSKMLAHYVDGRLIMKTTATFTKLQPGEEDYMCLGRDGRGQRALQGKLDELRISRGMVYTADFNIPESFSEWTQLAKRKLQLKKGPPLLFDGKYEDVIQLGSRKHLFVDDALFENPAAISFVVNPPRMAERVIDNIQGSFRKHLNVVEDESGLIRMYYGVSDDYLAVRTSSDGINWRVPDLPNGRYRHHTNIVIHEPSAMGVVFLDPNSPKEERWKYISGFQDRGIFLFVSPDGYNFKRRKTALLPLWPGSQSNTFYDDQQQQYIAYHRADFSRGQGGSTQREFVMSRTKNPDLPWEFTPSTQEQGRLLAKTKKIKDLLPFYLDNGPLTPGGFAFEYPFVFTPDSSLDPADTDVYVPKAIKYPWAPDVYLAFPVMYFHYKKTSPVTRLALHSDKYQRGSGPLETQLAVSRDALNWQRYPRPAYVGIGRHHGRDVVTAYLAQGLVKRGDEIWQYYFGETQYHSAIRQDPQGRGVYRLVQRLDGFVSVDSPYDKEVQIITRPFTFSGKRLLLNIDTDATGYTQVGFVDENNNPLAGYSVDDCIYINGDFIDAEVEWLQNRKEVSEKSVMFEEDPELLSQSIHTSNDVSHLAGKKVKLVFRMRGSKLYAMQFADR